MQTVAGSDQAPTEGGPSDQYAVVRMPRHRLSSIIAILQGLEPALPEAGEIQGDIEILEIDGKTLVRD